MDRSTIVSGGRPFSIPASTFGENVENSRGSPSWVPRITRPPGRNPSLRPLSSLKAVSGSGKARTV